MTNEKDKNQPQEIPTQKKPLRNPPLEDGNSPDEDNPVNPKSDE